MVKEAGTLWLWVGKSRSMDWNGECNDMQQDVTAFTGWKMCIYSRCLSHLTPLPLVLFGLSGNYCLSPLCLVNSALPSSFSFFHLRYSPSYLRLSSSEFLPTFFLQPFHHPIPEHHWAQHTHSDLHPPKSPSRIRLLFPVILYLRVSHLILKLRNNVCWNVWPQSRQRRLRPSRLASHALSASSTTLTSLCRADQAYPPPTWRAILRRNARSSIYKLQPLGRRRILRAFARCQFSYLAEEVFHQISRRRRQSGTEHQGRS